VPLLELRIKDNVDLAGLSPPLDLLRELTSYLLDHLFHYLNKTSLIALLPKVMKVAMVV